MTLLSHEQVVFIILYVLVFLKQKKKSRFSIKIFLVHPVGPSLEAAFASLHKFQVKFFFTGLPPIRTKKNLRLFTDCKALSTDCVG